MATLLDDFALMAVPPSNLFLISLTSFPILSVPDFLSSLMIKPFAASLIELSLMSSMKSNWQLIMKEDVNLRLLVARNSSLI